MIPVEGDAEQRSFAGAGADKGTHGENDADQLGEHGSRGGTGGSGMQKTDQYEVARDVEHAADDQDVEGAAGIPEGPQDAREHIVHRHGPQASEIDAHVGQRHGPDLLRHGHDLKKRRGGQAADHGEQDTEDESDGKGGAHGEGQFPLDLRSEQPGDHDRGSGRKAGEEIQRELEHRVDGVDGGQALLPGEPADDDRVHGGIQLLDQASRQNGKYEREKDLPDRALA